MVRTISNCLVFYKARYKMSAFWDIGKRIPLYSKPSLFHKDYVLHSAERKEGMFTQHVVLIGAEGMVTSPLW